MPISEKVLTRAIAVVAVGVASMALSGCAFLNQLTPGADGSSSSSSSEAEGEQTDVFSLAVGDCLNDEASEGEISEVPTTDCAGPHDSEIFASLVVPDGDFPGTEAIATEAETGCEPEFESFIGLSYQESELYFSYISPTEQSWDSGDREILCVVYDPNAQVEGSLQGSAR